MYMTANRLKIEGKPVLKLNIHDFAESEVPFLDSLGIDNAENDTDKWRYILIHSQKDFLRVRSIILERYTAEEKGPRVFLELK